MKTKLILLAIGAAAVLLPGCKKKEVVEIKEWAQFSDPYFKVTFSYPKGWVPKVDGSKISMYNTDNAEAMTKFFDRDARKPDGIQVLIEGVKLDTVKDLKVYAGEFESDRNSEGYKVLPVVDRTIEGLPAREITLSGQIDPKTKLHTIRTFVIKDSSLYTIDFSGFNDIFEPYKVAYDSIVASMTLPKPKEKSKDPNADVIPATTTRLVKNDVLEITVPENMNDTYPAVKGEVAYSMNLMIYRKDCTIDFDVRPAKKLSLDKVVEQNSKKIANVTGKGSATVSGEKAQYFNYSPVKGVESRIYFVVKNDKIYRIILNYATQMKKEFLPAFEKAVASIRIK